MSWFSDFLGSISGSDQYLEQARASQAKTNEALDIALGTQREARRRAEIAATPALDKESTILAGEARARRMLQAAGFRFSGQPLGDAPIGYTTAYGE